MRLLHVRERKLAVFLTAFNWAMDSEDSTRSYAIVPDVGGDAISGINSAVFPSPFAIIAAIPQAQRGPAVATFYESTFWNRWFAQLVSDDVAKRVFDSAVNQGPGTAVRILQTALNTTHSADTPSSLDVDGAWGPLTVSAANYCGDALVPYFQQVRIAAYKAIVAANPSDQQYLAGWIARAER